jgi:hypothetical protein
MEIFMLALRSEATEKPNINYIRQLNEHYGKLVSTDFITGWFKKISVPRFVSESQPYPPG